MNLGQVKNHISRASGYISILNMMLILTSLLVNIELDYIYWPLAYFLGLVFVMGVAYIDAKLIYENEQKYVTNKNPIFREMNKNIKEIKELINK